MTERYEQQYEEYRELIEDSFSSFLPERPGDVLQESMRYSLLAGGKRLRPVLTLAWNDLCGGVRNRAIPGAAAVEMVHTYSLIHDDLPCMDNDDLRRGKPTNHVVFGEYTALLAGSGLYDRALAALLQSGEKYGLREDQILASVRCLCRAAGTEGILTGQMLDMQNNNVSVDRSYLEQVNAYKTASMLQAACELGCIAADAPQNVRDAARRYGETLGQAFQIRDDLLDCTGTAAVLGKTPGKDCVEHKKTFVNLLGIEGAQSEVDRLSREAEEILSAFENAFFLKELTRRMCRREN